jgi:hypothetical protein
MQPVEYDSSRVIRFKQNNAVAFLYEWARDRGMGLNELHAMNFPTEDHEQFAQLIGYSVSGFSDLSYISEPLLREAKYAAERLRNDQPTFAEALSALEDFASSSDESEEDRKSVCRVLKEFKKRNFKKAYSVAKRLDTFVREGIPELSWNYMVNELDEED